MLAVSSLIVLAEGVGIVGELRLWWVIIAAWLGVGMVAVLLHFLPSQGKNVLPPGTRLASGEQVHRRLGPVAAAVALWLVIAQWAFATVDVLGSGIESFDSLWYHMPIAAAFAQSGSVTGILFPEADPFNAYFPANSELLHGLGIIAFGNDFLSPLLNLFWLTVGLLACWCVGVRWRVSWWTLSSGAVLFALPVLGIYEPGQALNDVVGLAALAVAVALITTPRRGWFELGGAALALGLAVGTKWTFILPAGVLTLGVVWLERRRSPGRVAAVMLGGGVLTSGWWYLRALIHTGSPLALSQRIGPVHLPGAASPLSTASGESVFTAMGHGSFWTSRLIPGLAHALGPLWPLILIVCVGGVLIGWRAVRNEPLLGLLTVSAGLAAVGYIFTPATAQNAGQSSLYFTYDVRFLTPAMELAFLLLPPILASRTRRLLPVMGAALITIAISAQLEHNLWPTQLARHVAFLAITAIAGTLVLLAINHRAKLTGSIRWLVAGLLLVCVLAVGAVAEHHYTHRRYLVDGSALGQIYRWAQSINHARIALYGTVEQYPLYGATDTNSVTYLGQGTAHGGYAPIRTCAAWQHAVSTGGYEYLLWFTPDRGDLIYAAWAS